MKLMMYEKQWLDRIVDKRGKFLFTKQGSI